MLVLIDESGCPGFKLDAGSTATFTVALAIFKDFKEAERASAAIAKLRLALGVSPEFKFNRCKPEFKDRFFDTVMNFDFSVRAIVVIKENISSDNLKTNKDRFYNYFVQTVLHHDNGVLENAHVKIDGSGNRKFRQELFTYLRRSAGEGKIKKISLKDSKKDNLIQLADMCAGAIARKYNSNKRKDHDRWIRMLAHGGKIDDVWEFK